MTNVNAELQGTLDACQHFHSVLRNEYGLYRKRVHLLTLQTLAVVAIRVTVCPADARALGPRLGCLLLSEHCRHDRRPASAVSR